MKLCPEFIRHKTTLIHPDRLLSQGIKLRRAIQRPREYVISRAAAYHSGFNGGYNIAEAVNFALPAWLDVAEGAKSCKCVRDSVTINIPQFKRKMQGLPPLVEEESVDESVDSDLLSEISNSDSALLIEEQLDQLCRHRGRVPIMIDDKAKGVTARCHKCKLTRCIPRQKMLTYKQENWKTNFLCYKLRSKNVVCYQKDQSKSASMLLNQKRTLTTKSVDRKREKKGVSKSIFRITKLK